MKSKRILSLIMAVILLMALAVPAFASGSDDPETVTVDSGEFGVKTVLSNENDGISPRFPGTAGLYSVVVYPAKVGDKQYFSSAYTGNYSGNGRTSILNVTLDDATRKLYDSKGADGYYAEVTFNLTGVTRYEVFLNGTLVGSENCAGTTKETLWFLMYDYHPAIWKVVLYDNNTTNGKSTWGHIYYQ